MLWNYKTQQLIYDIAAHSLGKLYGVTVAFNPDGKILVSGGPDNLIKIWHVKTGKQLATLSGHSKAVTSVAFSPDGKILASGSGDGTIKLWQRQ
jgi:WD40 repeat protein